MAKKTAEPKSVEALVHDEATRKNIPTAEYQSVVPEETQTPVRVAYGRRNPDLDPQLIWRGKYDGDETLTVMAPPLYIQEKVHPKVLVEDLLRQSKKARPEQEQYSLFSDFNGVPEGADKTDFYQHDQNWTNRMILGDSLQVMASLSEREGLRGQVQCIYLDPPYGIKFNSNFQWSTTSRDVKDGKLDNITREPEQVRAFRDTWRDGIHSYLNYLRDRFIIARELLTESGSIFVQIGDENVHRMRAVLDEVFGEDNMISAINFAKTSGSTDEFLGKTTDYILWYSKDKLQVKFKNIYKEKKPGICGGTNYNRFRDELGFTYSECNSLTCNGNLKIYSLDNLTSQSAGREKGEGASSWFGVYINGQEYKPSLSVRWKTNEDGMKRLKKAGRLEATDKRLGYVRYLDDFPVFQVTGRWEDVSSSFMSDKVYVVQTSQSVIQRCLLMATDPGDLVLDPTCGSGTTAYVSEQWGRRWITIDTSRVALALARARIMGARYPYYLKADSPEGQRKEAEITRTEPSTQPTYGNIRLGFVYERVPHITLKSIANNAEIDVIYDSWERTLEPLRAELNETLGRAYEEWEIPREAEDPWDTATQTLFGALRREQEKGKKADTGKMDEWLHGINHNLNRAYTIQSLPERPADPWPAEAQKIHVRWWDGRIKRQQEIDASIAAKADYEFLYDKPYEDKRKVRVAGPFTVESISPHRVLGVGADDELLDPLAAKPGEDSRSFVEMILNNLKTAGVQQAHKEDRITFTSLVPWPGAMVCAEGRYQEGEQERRAGIFIGPEFGTVSRQDLVAAAREAGDAAFDVLIACAFNYEAMATEFNKLGRIPILKARMNADLHMGEELKNTGKGNLFVIFGEPDITILPETKAGQETGQIRVKVNGVDVFHPNTGEIRSSGSEGIACWFIDTDYNEESFFVRQAYFLGANDPYKALKTSLKAEIDADAWASLHRDTSRPFDKPKSGRIAVKVINHLGDEVMKVFKI